jgi:hypothetical protein
MPGPSTCRAITCISCPRIIGAEVHLLECAGLGLRLEIQREGDYHVALPETEDFVKADSRRDPAADLAKAEGAKK